MDTIEQEVELVEFGPRIRRRMRPPGPALLGLGLGAIVISALAALAINQPVGALHPVAPTGSAPASPPLVYFDASTWQVDTGGTGRVLVGGELGNSGSTALTVSGLTGVVPGGRLVAVSYHGRPLGDRNEVKISPGSSDIVWIELFISNCPTARAGQATLLVRGSSDQQQMSASISPGFSASSEPWLHDILHCGR